jgi:CRISPR-associated protein Cas5d
MPAAIPISLKVWGDLACFTTPEAHVERLSYPVITPSAARGILEAVLWKPQIRYEIDRITVLKPIRFISIRRNEIQGTITVKGVAGVNAWIENPSAYEPYFVDSAGRDDAQGEYRTQRNSVLLRDVAYLIEARLIVKNPTPDDSPPKYREMFARRAAQGQCIRQPCLGIARRHRNSFGREPRPRRYALRPRFSHRWSAGHTPTRVRPLRSCPP